MAMLTRPSSAMKAFTVAGMIAPVLFTCVFGSAGTNHTVGGLTGWDVTANLEEWAAFQTFHVNDTLVFIYGPNHDVIEVRESDFDSCRMVSPIHTFDDGETVVELLRPGPRFFICGRNNYCKFGLKLKIQVQDRDELGVPSPIAQSPFPNGTSSDDFKRHGGGRRPPRSPPSPHRRPPPPPTDEGSHDKGGHDNGGHDAAPAPSSGRKLLSFSGQEGFSLSFSSSNVMVLLLALIVLWAFGIGLFGLFMLCFSTVRLMFVVVLGKVEATDLAVLT